MAMGDRIVILALTHSRWICLNRRKQNLSFFFSSSHTFCFFCYRRMSLVDDDPEDVVNVMQASVWGGEFLLQFLTHVI